MKTLVIAAGLTAFASLSAAMFLNKALDAERASNAKLEARIASLEAEQRALAEQRSAMPPMLMAAPPPVAVPEPARMQARVASAARPTAAPPPAPPQPNAEMMERLREQHRQLMNDPEFRAGMRAQQRRGLMHTYPSLARDLGISREEASELLDLLAEQQLRMSEESRGFDAASPEEHQRRFAAQRAQSERELQALLGTEKFREWTDYQQTTPARHEARRVQDMLSAVDMPLTDSQSKQMVATFAREQQRMQEESTRILEANGRRPDAFERFRELNEQRQTRIIDALAGVLNSQQLEHYRETVEEELQMQRAQERIMRAQREAQGQTGNWASFSSGSFNVVDAHGVVVPAAGAQTEQ